MLSLASKPKFFILNALRAFSLLSLLFVFIANIVIMAQDIQALKHNAHDTDHEDCDYIEGSGVPNQPAGNFRAFLSISLNIVETLILILSEIGFPASFFKKWIPCLDNEHSLVGLGVLELLLAAQMMSHFMETFPLVACFFLLIAGIFNICTMYFDRPKFFRSYAFWKSSRAVNDLKSVESGASRIYSSPHNRTVSAAPSIFTEKEHSSPVQAPYGFGRQDSGEPILSRPLSPPNYSPPQRPITLATKNRNRAF
jgi:Fe-S-cluster containining protein